MMKKMKQIAAALLAAVVAAGAVPSQMQAADWKKKQIDTEWYNFRNNAENNGITDRPTPTEVLETVQKWAGKYGTGWTAAPTPPLILDGKLYIGVANQIIELDKETGEELRRSDAMIGNVGYAMNPLTYADGKLFAQVGNGVIQAVDFQTLQCVWYSEKIGGQTLCPISYTVIDGTGYLYSGTWASESRDGSYFCVSTDDTQLTEVEGETKGGGKVKQLTWTFTPSLDDPQLTEEEKRGFYWAGAYACENYVAVGSDDGTSEGDYTKQAVFYTLNPLTGEVIDSIPNIAGDIRTTTVYDNGYLYFATKGGVLYKTKVSEDGHFSETSSMDIGAVTGEKVMATAAPVVYGEKIYMGVSGAGGQFDPDGGHGFRVIDNSKPLSQESVLYNIQIPGYPQAAALASTAHVKKDFDGDGQADGRVYLYFTYNAQPGGIYYCYDTAEQTESNPAQSGELFVPPSAQQQYCISTICADREGTLYYKNDSGYLMAVERNSAYLDNLTVSGKNNESISWNQPFDAAAMEYTLKIPAAMEKVTVTLDKKKGVTAAVNGTPYEGEMEIALNEGDTKAEITVSKKESDKTYKRTYHLNFVRVKSISTLAGMKVGNSNAFTGFLEMTPEFSSETTEYCVDTSKEESFWRVWLKKTDADSKITVTAGENVKEIKTSAGNATTDGHDRWNVYKEDETKTADIRIEVLSEDGEQMTTYHLSLSVPVKVTGIVLDREEAEIDMTDTLQLHANVMPEDASVQTVKWYSSDETIASVSENGLVTPKNTGDVTITAISDDGASITAACAVSVKDKAAEVDRLIEQIGDVTLESKAAIDVARNAYHSLNEKQKERVTQLESLEAAEMEYKKLAEAAEKEEADKAAADAVDRLIETIGKVTLASGDAIQYARTAYDALTEEQRVRVTKLDMLESAEQEYQMLCFAEKKEQAEQALASYKNKNDYRQEEQQELLAILEQAKRQIEEAKEEETVQNIVTSAKAQMDKVKTDADWTKEEREEAAKRAAAETDKKILAIGEVTLEKAEQIAEARKSYDALSEEAKAFVEHETVLLEAEETWKKLQESEGSSVPSKPEQPSETPSGTQKPEQPDSSDKTAPNTQKPKAPSKTETIPTGDAMPVKTTTALGMAAVCCIILLSLSGKKKQDR